VRKKYTGKRTGDSLPRVTQLVIHISELLEAQAALAISAAWQSHLHRQMGNDCLILRRSLTISLVTSLVHVSLVDHASLITSASSALQAFQLLSLTITNQSPYFPRLNKVFLAALIDVPLANIAFNVSLALTPYEIFFTLTRLVCLFYAIFAQVITHPFCLTAASRQLKEIVQNVNVIWAFVHPAVSKLRRPFYMTIALQLSLFGVGIFFLLCHNLQLVWCLPAIVLWLYFVVHVHFFMQLRKDNHCRWEIVAGALALGDSAVAFTILKGFGVARHWAALFYIEFFALELVYSWNIIILRRK
jgi:hypothetical protein